MSKNENEHHHYECDDCEEDDYCDLDPSKICDNCGKCLETGDYISIKIDGIYDENGNIWKGSVKNKK